MALTADDLATLTNRGTVKRWQKELEAGEVTCELREEPGGDLVFAWSDGITCRFPSGKAVHDAVCSSGAAGITRHVVRSVLAYQRAGLGSKAASGPADAGREMQDGNRRQEDLQAAETASCFVAGEIWDPGQISDGDLIARFRSAAVTKARKRFEQGVLVELSRGTKPTARFLDEACTVRFWCRAICATRAPTVPSPSCRCGCPWLCGRSANCPPVSWPDCCACSTRICPPPPPCSTIWTCCWTNSAVTD